MLVRPGQHVDPQGRVYHPYLVRWAEFWDVSAARRLAISIRVARSHVDMSSFTEVVHTGLSSHTSRHLRQGTACGLTPAAPTSPATAGSVTHTTSGPASTSGHGTTQSAADTVTTSKRSTTATSSTQGQ